MFLRTSSKRVGELSACGVTRVCIALRVTGPLPDIREERNVASLPVLDDRFTHVVDVGLSASLQLASFHSHLVDEVFRVNPVLHTEDVNDVLRINHVKDRLDVQ